MTTRSCAAFAVLASLVAACSSSSGGTTKTVGDSGTQGTPDAHHATSDSATSKDAGGGAPDATPDVTSSTSDASDAGTGASEAAADAGAEAAPFVPIDAGGGPITGTTAQTWNWVPFPDAKCRDGSTTGLGVNLNPASPNVLIYLEGGGACFNFATCAGNPSSFGAPDFAMRFPTDGDGGAPESGNVILDRTNTANPVADWNFIYVPYCTGDIHAGNNVGVMINDVVGPQSFVGYQNVNLYLERLVPTFAASTHVVLTGISGGGFGAAANYEHVRRAFGSIPVDLIDDSGPFMEDPYLPACLQNEVRALWGLDSTVGVDCGGDCSNDPTFFIDFAKHILTQNPQRQFGLMDSLGDQTITAFFGFGASDCAGFAQETATTFTAGLNDIRTHLSAETNLSTFYFAGTDHTSLGDDNFYTRTTTTADGGVINLPTWVADVVGGKTNVAGP